LQLAFERVIAMLASEVPANEAAADPSAAHGGDEATAENESNQGQRRKKHRRRHKHGRRPLDLTNLPVIEQVVKPEEVTEAGGVGYELIGEETSERVGWRPGSTVAEPDAA
jgi:hypothetical protein